jgi:hypothetical protein
MEDQVGAVSKHCLASIEGIMPNGYVVVLDIAGMHALNHALGMGVVDGKLKSAHVKSGDTIIKIAGDEYAVCVHTQAEASAMALRLSQLYADEGMTAYFEVARYSYDLIVSINTCLDRIMARKARRDNYFTRRLVRAWGILVDNGSR